jgi:hypothetical protein
MKLLPVFLFFTIALSSSAQHINVMLGNQRNPNEPSIAINPKNTNQMVAGANIDNYYYSDDAGYTWQNNRLFSPQLGVWGDPCIAVDTSGSFYFFHLSNPIGASWIDRIVCQRTDDFTVTWTDGTGIGLNSTKAQDKEWVAIDPENNHIYVTWTQFDNYGSANPADSSIIRFSKSYDRGDTWTEPLRLNKIAGDCIDSDNTVEGAVPAIGPEGQIYVAWAGPEGILFDRSLDGGETWLDNDIYVSDQPGGWDFDVPGIMRCNGLPVTACDLSNSPHRGTIYVNWTDQRNGANDTDVWLVKSTDGGNSWSERIRVNNDEPGKQQFFSWMTVDPANGKIWIVYYDRRNYNDNQTDVFLALSEDGGNSFTNFKISESPFIPVESVFFGDYTNISAINDVVRPVWTRLHQNQLSIYTAIIDIQSVVSDEIKIPAPFATVESWPNPFSASTAFSFKLTDLTKVNISLLDVTGRTLWVFIDNQYLEAGKYTLNLEAENHNLKQGVYFLKFWTPSGLQTRKLVYSP